jgi:molybdopterin adenylyltransferase
MNKVMGLWRVAVLTCSTRAARGLRRDRTGPLIQALCRKWWPVRKMESRVLPDQKPAIARCLRAWCRQGMDLIITTGGTGFSPTDVTPEATADVVTRLAPGLAEAVRQAGSRRTSMSWLSRGAAGLRGRTVIVNLPGSLPAVRDGMRALKTLVPHALDIASGRHRGQHVPEKRRRGPASRKR